MDNIAFIYPGQGSHFCGMGKDFYIEYQICREIFEMATDIMNVDMKKLCFEYNTLLNQTEYTQIAVFTVEMAMYKVLEQFNIRPEASAGHSLGEYSALVTTGAITMEKAFKLVKKRGELMAGYCKIEGIMMAIIGLRSEIICDICKEFEGKITIANYNCPGQIVVSGEKETVFKAIKEFEKAGAMGCIQLSVSGPFHTKYMLRAGEMLINYIKDADLKYPEIPLFSNVTGKKIKLYEDISRLVSEQVYSPVMWQSCIEEMINLGVKHFVEIGPGNTLTKMLKRICSECDGTSIQRIDDLEKLLYKMNA